MTSCGRRLGRINKGKQVLTLPFPLPEGRINKGKQVLTLPFPLPKGRINKGTQVLTLPFCTSRMQDK